MFVRQMTFKNLQDYSKSLNYEASYKNKHMRCKTLHFKSSGCYHQMNRNMQGHITYMIFNSLIYVFICMYTYTQI